MLSAALNVQQSGWAKSLLTGADSTSTMSAGTKPGISLLLSSPLSLLRVSFSLS